MKHMAWGAARQLFNSAPPVVAARNIQHNFQLAASAVRSAREGDWGQAFSTLLEMPEKTALGAARVLTGPIDAALSIPASVQAAMNPEVDPEMRGAAMVQGAQAVIAVVAAVVGAASGARSRKDPNTATWELHDANGTLKMRGSAVSGGTTPGRRLSFPEQQRVHTEGKILTDTEGKTSPGDLLTIRGREVPCRMCKSAMHQAAKERRIKIGYTDETSKTHTF